MSNGKKYTDSAKLIEKAKLYDSADALNLVCQTAKAKFDETIEVHVRLGVDSRHADQQVRGAVVLPNGTGKTVRTLVFAKGDRAKAAEEAGADFVGELLPAFVELFPLGGEFLFRAFEDVQRGHFYRPFCFVP